MISSTFTRSGVQFVAAGCGFLAWARNCTQKRQKPAAVECCGIVGFIGSDDVEPVLMHGIRVLQNRGYDSCGMSTLTSDSGSIVTTKFASRGTTSDCIKLLSEASPLRHRNHRIGIAHTRWATHGGKTDLNAHPHSDWLEQISLVHNGSIDNYLDLKAELEEQGAVFHTPTDTEVIANLIGMYLKKQVALDVAVAEACERLVGTWGLVVMERGKKNSLVCARNGSPLLIGCNEDAIMVASEAAALAGHTNSYVPLRDGEVVLLVKGKPLALTGKPLPIPREKVPDVTPAPFSHWTLREICEQPKSLVRALNYGGRIAPAGMKVKLGGLDSRKDELRPAKHLVLSGCGTSFYAALFGQKLMESMGVFETVTCIDASELTETAIPRGQVTCVVFLSQSGETLDVIQACQVAENRGCIVISLVNAVGSHLARRTGCGVYLNAGREVAVASTKAFTSQVLVLALLAAWFGQTLQETRDGAHPPLRRQLLDSINRAPLQCGMTLSCRDECHRVARDVLKDAQHLFILGKGYSYSVALEGALKIKEITYTHAEGFTASALKHGPFALLDDQLRTPVILLAPSDDTLPILLNCAQQVKARGARIIGIVDAEGSLKGLADELIIVPENGALTALNMVIPLQLIAYELAIIRGVDPDKPRGLAKTVTVL